MTQDEYKLWTGEATTLSNEDWARLVQVASCRLASFLCLDGGLPVTGEGKLPDNLQMLLANFICGVVNHQGNDTQVEEKRVRNFTIRFSSNSAANAFANLAKNYGDIIDSYSECGSAVGVEGNFRSCCYGRF